MPLAGVAIHVWGSRRVVVLASLVTCATLPFLAVPLNTALLIAALVVFGASLGALDVAMNAQALAVQHAAGRPIMSGFHALFSVGGLAGAALISLLLRGGAGLVQCAAGIAVALGVLAVSQQRSLVADHGTAEGSSFTIVPKPAALLLGALCFMSFLGEGAVLDWCAVFLREDRRVYVAVAGAGYAAFSVAMAAMRFAGDRITHRFGPGHALRFGGALAAAGFVVVAAVPSAAGALAGFVVVGIGASNIVPILFTAAGRVPGVAPGIGLATVTTIGYVGLLLGPALIGFVAQATSLQMAFVLIAAMFASIAASAGRVTSA
jgi:predicted MFS family arabinose efflux permease